jgi:hypothetical protein
MSETNFVDLSRAHLGEWRDNVTKYAGKADGAAEGMAAGAVLGAVGSTAKFLWSLRNKEGRTAAKEMISGWGKKTGEFCKKWNPFGAKTSEGIAAAAEKAPAAAAQTRTAVVAADKNIAKSEEKALGALKPNTAATEGLTKVARKSETAALHAGEHAVESAALHAGEHAVENVALHAGEKLVAKEVEKTVAKTVGKSLLKKIPVIGLLVGVGFGVKRAMDGDFKGAGLEVASGAVSLLPGVGTAASVAIDVGSAARDISNAGARDPNQLVNTLPAVVHHHQRTDSIAKQVENHAGAVVSSSPSSAPDLTAKLSGPALDPLKAVKRFNTISKSAAAVSNSEAAAPSTVASLPSEDRFTPVTPTPSPELTAERAGKA